MFKSRLVASLAGDFNTTVSKDWMVFQPLDDFFKWIFCKDSWKCSSAFLLLSHTAVYVQILLFCPWSISRQFSWIWFQGYFRYTMAISAIYVIQIKVLEKKIVVFYQNMIYYISKTSGTKFKKFGWKFSILHFEIDK